MPEITFVVEPGADDILIDEVSLDAVDLFRSECLSGGAVSCKWDTLRARLENHDVSRFWWIITESERRSIAEQAIKNTLFYMLRYGRSGKANCEGGEGDVKKIVCVQNGLIRTLKFGDCSAGGDSCYYRRSIDSEEFCFVPNVQYKLPCHIVNCVTYGSGFGHCMCAIQVVERIDSIDNWIIFQYSDFDIQRGSPHIPNHEYDLYMVFGVLTSLSCTGFSHTTLARFEHI